MVADNHDHGGIGVGAPAQVVDIVAQRAVDVANDLDIVVEAVGIVGLEIECDEAGRNLDWKMT